MKHRDTHEESLERLAHQALRQLPPCEAPVSLEARVLHEIERRAALSRWRSGFAQWPMAARVALFAGCVASVPLVWMLVRRLWVHLAAALASAGFAPWIADAHNTGRTLLSLAELAVHLVRMIPHEWLFGGLLVTGAVYATLAAMSYLLLYPTLPHSKAHQV